MLGEDAATATLKTLKYGDQMIFSCRPPQGKCEWHDLKDFVISYNQNLGNRYARTNCLDVERRSDKEPEVRLESPGEVPIVIERKVVAETGSEYFSAHSKEHEFFDRFVDTVHLHSDSFRDSLYQLELDAEDLQGKSKKDVQRLAIQIAEIVCDEALAVKSMRGISHREPFPWHFYPLSRGEWDVSVPRTGVGVVVNRDPGPSEPSDIRQRIREAKAGYAAEFARAAKAASEKFERYLDCKRLLLVQFFGETQWVMDEDVVGIIASASVPEEIDEVWVASQEWINEHEHRVIWERVR